ncbi:MAG: transcriptional regulator [Betaproteobacteria bacterium RIFCSPLOWO2_12_FULL_64_23]|nr:MAG: transcriptional regulator [Betaproteobacteria bacterium RIFCSPLOWO2_12_FULL_64_23]
MSNPELKSRLLRLFPVFGQLDEAAVDAIVSGAATRQAPAGAILFEASSPCTGFPMLLEGSVRVVKSAPSGREVQLYRITPGESCLLSSSCLLGGTAYAATGIAETAVTLLALPPALFHRLLAEHKPFRDYVFGMFSERLADLMTLVEAVTFHKLDQRLAALLLGKGELVRTTHQGLADELGSVREMVSRLLSNFQDRGWVELGREQIRITDAAALRRLAQP